MTKEELDAQIKAVAEGVVEQKFSNEEYDKLAEKVVEQLKAKHPELEKKGLYNPTKDTMTDGQKKEVFSKFLRAWINKDMSILKDTVNKDMTTTSAVGIMLPPDFEAAVIMQANIYGLARRLATYEQVGPQTRNAVKEGADVAAAYVVEDVAYTTISDSNPVAVPVTLAALVGLAVITNEVDLFQRINVMEYLAKKFAKALNKAEDTQFFNGTGTPFTGVMNVALPAGQEFAISSGINLTNFVYTDLLKLIGNLPQGFDENPTFVMHKSVFFNRVMGMTDTQGRPIFWLVSENGKPVMTILGYPVIFSALLPDTTLNVTGTPFVVFGDFGEGSRFYEKEGLQVDESNSAVVGGYNAFTQRGKVIRFIDEEGMGIVDPRFFTRVKTA